MAQPVWNTPSGTIGTLTSGNEIVPIQVECVPVLPAVNISYQLLAGSLPPGLSLSSTGLITGTPGVVVDNTDYQFTIRATDNRQNIRDRSFILTVSGYDEVAFVTPPGTIIVTQDSMWIEYQLDYFIAVPDDNTIVRLIQGQLPPGLEINEYGLIRGYPEPPTIDTNALLVEVGVTSITDNILYCQSTYGFLPGRPIVFSNMVFGGIIANATYYILDVIDGNTFTISTSTDGTIMTLNSGTGYMNATLPVITIGEPISKTYNFTVKLEARYGSAMAEYSIHVINQNLSITKGGPGKPINTRIPALLNVRPRTYDIRQYPEDYDFYLFPDSMGNTYLPSELAYIGEIYSDNNFYFQMLGYDFDGNNIEYVFSAMPLGLIGDSNTGWIRGTPIILDNTIEEYSFGVSIRKKDKPFIATPFYNFSFKIKNGVDGNITWLTDNDLGMLFNGTESNLYVKATTDVDLSYQLVSGNLPPNLTLLANGEITGNVAFQPENTILPVNTITEYQFTVRAFNPDIPLVRSDRTFIISVKQEFAEPFETIYIKCTPAINDRILIRSLLNDETLIPSEYLYRPEDINYGKSTSVIYNHMYGVYASGINKYIESINENHYDKKLTLGEIKTAVARDSSGEIIYEVVYSSIIDNLINPEGISIDKQIFWPTFIPLGLGPWYTTNTSIYTSYIGNDNEFNTSLTPGYARILYPNSLPNMRDQIKDTIGYDYSYDILPKWMTSQQRDGNITGYVPAWVICYTKPGYSEEIKTNIESLWIDAEGNLNTLNLINFEVDKFSVSKINTYNYDTTLVPPSWLELPSASEVPDPSNSNDINVLFPRPTILPDDPQYPR